MTRFKPGASITSHLLLAALLWSIIGLLLIAFGCRFLFITSSYILLAIALVIGTAKSFLILDRVARMNSQRILQFSYNTCIGGVYSYKTWGLVIGMMLAGRLLRASSLPREIIGALYVAIGWGLFFSSRIVWQEWRARISAGRE